jgi:polynucleotide 5'-hydroxyl-kinase GRC3/NOL9
MERTTTETMDGRELLIPAQWQALATDLAGTVLVVGATDSGKSTLVRWLVRELVGPDRPVAWLDADPGQSTLGLPTTLNLALCRKETSGLPTPERSFFVGSTSPRGHMLPMLTGLRRLQEQALAAGCAALLIDSSGLVERAAGGGALKEWELELLRPQHVLALQRQDELEHLLGPLRRDRRFALTELPVSAAIRRRSPEERAANRRRQFHRYFRDAGRRILFLDELPVYGLERAAPERLLALLDPAGGVGGLGLLVARRGRELEILTPATGAVVAALRFGTLRIDAGTGEQIPT